MSEPVKLIITIDGGIITSICTLGVPAEVLVVDFDTHGADPDDLTHFIDGFGEPDEACTYPWSAAAPEPWLLTLAEQVFISPSAPVTPTSPVAEPPECQHPAAAPLVSPSATRPWQVLLWPDWYDDDDDHGYFWRGEATSEADAVRQACEQCMAINDVAPEEPGDRFLDPDTIDYTDAGPDYAVLFKRLSAAAAELTRLTQESLTQHIHDPANSQPVREHCAYTRAIDAVRAVATVA